MEDKHEIWEEKLAVVAGQIKTTAGSVKDNVQHILDSVNTEIVQSSHMVVFPEMSLTGYPVDDLLRDPDFATAIREGMHALSMKLPPHIPVLVGMPTLGEEQLWVDSVKRVWYNSAVLFWQGNHVAVAHKKDLPTYGVFDDTRWFNPTKEHTNPIVRFSDGLTVKVLICEDVWNPKTVQSNLLTHRKVISLTDEGFTQTLISDNENFSCDGVVVINASPYFSGKQWERELLIDKYVESYRTPFFYINAVGGQDEVVYDGGSFLSAPGDVKIRSSFFEEHVKVLQTTKLKNLEEENSSDIAREPPLLHAGKNLGNDFSQQPKRTLDLPGKEKLNYNALVCGLRDYVHGSHHTQVVLGLSGGLDSALAATIAVDALDASNVLGVMMPGPFSSQHSVEDAKELAKNLKIETYLLPINDLYSAEKEIIERHLTKQGDTDGCAGGDKKGIKLAFENIQARLRALHLMTIGNAESRIVLNTGNKSEMSMGYFTLGGDAAGGFAVLKDVYKTQVKQLAIWRNEFELFSKGRFVIPENSITKPPSAELSENQYDTDSLPPYELLDTILKMHLEKGLGVKEIVHQLSFELKTNLGSATSVEMLADKTFTAENLSVVVRKVLHTLHTVEYKRRQLPIGVNITRMSYGKERRYPIISDWNNHYAENKR